MTSLLCLVSVASKTDTGLMLMEQKFWWCLDGGNTVGVLGKPRSRS